MTRIQSIVFLSSLGILVLCVDISVAREPEAENYEIKENGQSNGPAEVAVNKVENSRWQGADAFRVSVKARRELFSSVEARLWIYAKDSQLVASVEPLAVLNRTNGLIATAGFGDFRVHPAYSEFSYCTIACYNAARTKVALYKIPLKHFVK